MVNQLETAEGRDSPAEQSFVSCSVAMQVFDGSSFPPQACKVFISRPDFPFQLIPLAPDPLTCFLVHYRDLIEETGAGRARCVCSGLDNGHCYIVILDGIPYYYQWNFTNLFLVTLSSQTWPPIERLKEGLVVPVATGTLNLLLPGEEVLSIFLFCFFFPFIIIYLFKSGC